MSKLFFSDWMGVLRVVVSLLLIYPLLILVLRVSGKRVLSKMNLFDFVVTVALGSTFATVLVSRNLPLVEGVLAIAGLVGLQVLVAWLSWRSERFDNLVKSQPRLIYFQGEFIEKAMEKERVSESEILEAIRSEGFSDPQDIAAVVLETNGKFSVLQKTPREGAVLRNVV